MTPEQLGRELQKGHVQHLYVCVGDNIISQKQVLTMLREQICPGDMATWSYQQIDGALNPGSALLAMANTPSFLGSLRLLVVLGYDQMPTAEQDILVAGLPTTDSVVVLLATSLDKRTKAVQSLMAKATPIEIAGPKPDAVVPWVKDQARLQGLTITTQAAQTLVNIAGSNIGFLAQELAKFATYLSGSGSNNITTELVLELAALGEAESEPFAVFRLTDALIDKNPAVALRQLHELLNTGEPALRLLGMIARQYRQLILGKAWANDGVAATARALKMKTYPVEKAFTQAKRLSVAEIEQSLKLILDADMALKSGGDHIGVLAMLTVKLSTRNALA